MQTHVATLRANQDMLNRTIAVAPFDGIVTNEPVREGETVVEGIQNTEGSTLMTLADMSVVTAEVKVDETDIVNVQLGQPADVSVDALPGKIFKGHVTLVGDQALLRSTGIATSQSTTGTEEAKDFKVVVTLDDPTRTSCAPASPARRRSPRRISPTCFRCPSRRSPCTTRRRHNAKSSGSVQAAIASPAHRQIESRAGRLCGREGPQGPAAREVRSRDHGHHRRNRYRSAFRPESGR